mgnify:CR=1 FL=1
MTKKMNIPFSPPDISEKEIEAVSEALRSGWITTGPRTKELERQMAEFTGTKRGACLNSATACMETALRLFGIGAGDEGNSSGIHIYSISKCCYATLVQL